MDKLYYCMWTEKNIFSCCIPVPKLTTVVSYILTVKVCIYLPYVGSLQNAVPTLHSNHLHFLPTYLMKFYLFTSEAV